MRSGSTNGLFAALALATAATAQGTTFQTELTKELQKHAFFKDVSFDVEADRVPFLFYLQSSLRRDERNYEYLVINPILPFLKELVSRFDATYCKPQGIVLREGMGQYAIAVLASRGLYDDYARATKDASLHMTLAHYNQNLRLAVTYRAGFGAGDPKEERHSLLHEVVHALQHAYSSTGQMTKPVWFNEGLAEYLSSCDHMPESLRAPPLLSEHVDAMIYAHGNQEGRKLLLPIVDLVVPETYAQVVEIIRKRAGTMVGQQGALGMFYAQSEMVVRFLHEGENGKYRDGVLRYFKAVEAGAAGLAAFHEAFGTKTPESLATMDREWQAWIGVVLARHLGFAVDAATGKGLERAALPPPVAFDRTTLAWQGDEFEQRLAAARRWCSLGEYDRALATLPGQADGPAAALLRRETKRMQALVDLRERVVADLKQRGTVELPGMRGGKFVRRDASDVVVLVKQTETRIRLDPSVLLAAGSKLKAFETTQSWLEAWLRWLRGERRAAMASLLERKYSQMEELRTDLTADLDAEYGTAALALDQLQSQALPEDRKGAQTALVDLTKVTRTNNELFVRRRAAVEQLARALAERAFALDDAEALGIHAPLQPLGDGRVRIAYKDPRAAPDADFSLAPDVAEQFVKRPGIAYEGPTCVQPLGDHWGAIGSGFLRWAMPLAGPHEIEFEYQLSGENSSISVVFCWAPGRHLWVAADGRLLIDDQTRGIKDSAGSSKGVTVDEPHRLRIVHDGANRASVHLDGIPKGQLPSVGNCIDGEFLLVVRSSTPVHIRNLTITGKLDPANAPAIRERYVEQALSRLWPSEGVNAAAPPAGAARPAAATPPAGEDQPAFAWRRGRKVVEPQSTPAITSALTWLVRHQGMDGRWDADAFMQHDTAGERCDGAGNPAHDVGVSALATLALLAEGNTTRNGPHNEPVRRAIAWLLSQQNMTSGAFSPMNHTRSIYDHALATIAVAEAAGISGDPDLSKAAQNGIAFLVDYRSPHGIWGYERRASQGTTSVTAWCLQALWTGRAVGLQVDKAALDAPLVWFNGVTAATGEAGYTSVEGGSSRYPGDHSVKFPIEKVQTLTAAALFGRCLLGQHPASVPVMTAASGAILRTPPVWDVAGGGIDECYWYFATHALHQCGGAPWVEWRKKLVDTLIKAQRRDGNFAGSWDPVGVWSQDGGRVCTTALLVLSLQVPYRYRVP